MCIFFSSVKSSIKNKWNEIELNKSLNSSRCFELGTCYTFDTSSSHGPMEFVFPLLGVIMPVLAVVTLVSNTIIIVILSRPEKIYKGENKADNDQTKL